MIWAFIGVGAFFVLVVLFARFSAWKRAQKVGREWKRVRGKVIEFGLTHSSPHVRYEYEYANDLFEGSQIVVNAKGLTITNQQLARRFYEDEYGRCRYVPGREVVVWVNPAKPDEAVLLPRSAGGIGSLLITLVIGVVVATGAWVVTQGVKIPEGLFFGGIFCLAPCLIASFILRDGLQVLRARDFSSTEGRILEASAMQDRKSFHLHVRYEYEVNGIRYVSKQLTAMESRVLTSNEEQIQKEIGALMADPKVRVFYNPRRPWVCHLRRGSLKILLVMILVTIVFSAAAIKMLMS